MMVLDLFFIVVLSSFVMVFCTWFYRVLIKFYTGLYVL